MRELTGMLDGTYTTPTPGVTQDMGSERAIAAHLVISAMSGSSATFVLEDSADGVNWGAVATSSAVTSAPATVALRSTLPAPTGRYARVRLSAFTGTSVTLTAQARAV